MRKYIIQSEMGNLCKTKGVVTDEDGRKRRGLVYWSDFSNDKIIKFFYLPAYLQYIFIKALAPDIKEVRVSKVNDVKPKQGEEQ